MKLSEFKKKMKKPFFTWAEACRVAWATSPEVLRLNLFNWRKKGELLLLKRGRYLFPDIPVSKTDISSFLYAPSYLSLEWALHHYGVLPDVVFSMTSVSTRGSRRFRTPLGEFIYHKIEKDFFWGFHPESHVAFLEKALVDYFYFYSGRLLPEPSFWKEMRWQNLDQIQFAKAKEFARRLGVKKLEVLVRSLEKYAKA